MPGVTKRVGVHGIGYDTRRATREIIVMMEMLLDYASVNILIVILHSKFARIYD